jgi:hypothetical protein
MFLLVAPGPLQTIDIIIFTFPSGLGANGRNNKLFLFILNIVTVIHLINTKNILHYVYDGFTTTIKLISTK